MVNTTEQMGQIDCAMGLHPMHRHAPFYAYNIRLVHVCMKTIMLSTTQSSRNADYLSVEL